MATMFNLPDELAEEILSRVPLTSLSSVRSTCRKWDTLSQNRVFGTSASAGRKQFLGFMLKDYKVCSMKFDLQGIGNERDFIDSSIKQVSILDQVEITQVFQREGLLLCITKDKKNRPKEIISFDFTTERFGKRLLPLPSKSHSLDKFVSLSCVIEEQLAVLHVSWVNAHAVEIWVKNKIAPGAVSWIKFVRSISVFVDDLAGNFFITRKSKLLWVTI
ncbi:unnamed protein product [Brassica rapa]|uniref:F-box domain-containing protein n=1 Tax=Brassica campestris TaxID=3711 RepID=A0A8D9H0E3_BRACM|nr:unnamed protein product [Brassica rapa]